VTDSRTTVLTTGLLNEDVKERIKDINDKIDKEKQSYIKKRLKDRLAILSGSVGIIRVGGNSKIELKERKDRVEDAIYAVKAALQEGIVPGGGVALKNAADNIKPENNGERVLIDAITSPYFTILENAGIEDCGCHDEGIGIDVITGEKVNMIKSGIVDPVLVTKTALKNAVSVVSTVISADCVISNIRVENASS